MPWVHYKRLSIALVALLSISLSDANADLKEDLFTSTDWKVSIRSPKGWHASESYSYPNILLWMQRKRPDVKMLFSAEAPPEAVRDSQSYANFALPRLEEMGYRTRAPQIHSATGAWWIDYDDGTHFLRQAFLVRPGANIAYSLTLSAKDLRSRGQSLRAFDYSLRSLRTLP